MFFPNNGAVSNSKYADYMEEANDLYSSVLPEITRARFNRAAVSQTSRKGIEELVDKLSA
jgi:hypothetical protein